MRLISLFTVLWFILYISIGAQTKITIGEAINMAFQNNMELNDQEAKIKHADSQLSSSSRLPNPTFSYTREDLSTGNVNFDEWSALGSIPINFLWARWDNIEAKENLLSAQKLLYEGLKINTATKVNQTYSSFHYFLELFEPLESLVYDLEKLNESAHYRLNEGDISEYELQRIVVELSKIKSSVSDIKIEKDEYQNELKLLIGLEAEDAISTLEPKQSFDTYHTEKELIALALLHRNDLKALKLIVESEKSNLAFAKTKIIPDITVSAGYKQQSDDLKGSVIQVDLALPIFNRNQSEIEKSEIDISIFEKEYLFKKQKIKKEVIESFNRYQQNKRLYNDINNLSYEDLFLSSSFSYQQGEISLVEFIDGINAFMDGLLIKKQTEINFKNSYYNLEKVVGVSLTNFEDN